MHVLTVIYKDLISKISYSKINIIMIIIFSILHFVGCGAGGKKKYLAC